MTSNEANKININEETNLDKLRELVKFWQELAYLAEVKILKFQPTFAIDDLFNLNDKNETNLEEK